MSLHEFDESWDQIDWRHAVPKLIIFGLCLAIWFLGVWKAIDIAWWLI